MKIFKTPEIISGINSIQKIGSIFETLNSKKVLVVAGNNVTKAGIYNKVEGILSRQKIDFAHFRDISPEPDIALMDSLKRYAREYGPDTIIGIGGGSALDLAKLACCLVTNKGQVKDYLGINLIKHPGVNMIAIPTTAGTGSEVTPISVLSDPEEELKKAIVSPNLIPDYAIIDPKLSLTMPPMVTATSGMDALVHAIEAYTSNNINAYSDCLAIKAIELINENLCEAYKNGNNLQARENMLIGSLFAGMAFSNAGVAAVHAFAYPLGAMFHLSHGLSNSLMLSSIIKHNYSARKLRYDYIAYTLTGKPKAALVDIISRIENLKMQLNLPSNLLQAGIPESSLDRMAQNVMNISRLLGNNPQKITQNDAVNIYNDAAGKEGYL